MNRSPQQRMRTRRHAERPPHSGDRPGGRRRGVSLIEMLAVITTMSVVGTLSVTTMFFMLRAEGGGAKSLFAGVAYSRLSHDFRRDVHAAIAANPIGDGSVPPRQLDLLQPDEQTVSYTIRADRIVRTVHRNGKRVATDGYVLAEGASHFELEARSPLIALVHLRRGVTFSGTAYEGAPVRAYRIEAVRGRDYRFDSTHNTQSGRSLPDRGASPTEAPPAGRDQTSARPSRENPPREPNAAQPESQP